MSIPTFTMRQLLEAGIHFGHHTRRWNPKMEEYIFGQRNNIHIIDLEKTMPMLYNALEVLHNISKNGGYILFVGTKRSASDVIATSAKNCGQFYVNHRWLGGMLTNWETVSKSIKRLKELEKKIETGEVYSLTKKERLNIERSKNKLELTLGGIKNMTNTPDALFIIDTNKESIAVAEANKLNIPVIAVCDTNTDPSNIDFPIPGNDDAVRAISLYCDLVGSSILSGMEENLNETGVDIGALEKNLEENLDLKDESENEKENASKNTEIIADSTDKDNNEGFENDKKSGKDLNTENKKVATASIDSKEKEKINSEVISVQKKLKATSTSKKDKQEKSKNILKVNEAKPSKDKEMEKSQTPEKSD